MSEEIQYLLPEQQAYLDTKFQYAELLRNSSTPAIIKFIKLNGDERIMSATLNPSVAQLPAVTSSKESTLSNMVVFDTEVNGWRTITLNRVQSFVVEGIEYAVTSLQQLDSNNLPVVESDVDE